MALLSVVMACSLPGTVAPDPGLPPPVDGSATPLPRTPAWAWGATNTVSEADASFVGEDPGTFALACVAPAGDLDGDGYGDLTFAAVHDAEWWAYVLPGGPRQWSHGMPIATLPSIGAGCGVPIGDANGDGFDDLVVDTQLVFGSEPLWPAHMRDADVVGPSTYSTFGAVGDTDGDGADDWMVQSPNYPGQMIVFRNPESGTLVSSDAGLALAGGTDGQTMFTGSGDLTGDGIADILASAASGGQHVWIIAGGEDWPDGTTADVAAVATFSRDENTIFPYVPGDLDDDGVADLQLWGSGLESDPDGGPHLFRGGPSIEGVLEMDDANIAGIAVRRLGDLNGDGFTEVEIRDELGIGVWGGTGSWPDAVTSADADAALEVGASIASVENGERYGDLDGDGYGDLFLGNPIADTGALTYAGTIDVVPGAEKLPSTVSLELAEVRFEGSVSHQRFGLGMVVMDLDGDAYDDLVVGSSVHPLETGEGELFVFFGHP